MTDYQFMTHEPWCSWFLDDEYESCDCGYREDLMLEDDPKYAEGDVYGKIVITDPHSYEKAKRKIEMHTLLEATYTYLHLESEEL